MNKLVRKITYTYHSASEAVRIKKNKASTHTHRRIVGARFPSFKYAPYQILHPQAALPSTTDTVSFSLCYVAGATFFRHRIALLGSRGAHFTL